MIKKRKLLEEEHIPEIDQSIANMPEDSKIFVEKSLEIANYLMQLLQEKNLKQKDLADKLGKTEAEVSKWLAGMHNFTLRSLSKLEAALEATVICTPRNLQKSVRVTNDRRIQSVNTIRHRGVDNLDTTGKVVYMKNNCEINNEMLKDVV